MNNIVRNEDGKLLSFEYVKDNKDVVLPVISEGNKNLEDILSFCVDNDIPTIACCSGHKRFDLPYITIGYDSNNCKVINGFLNRLKNISGVKIVFSSTGFSNNRFCVTVYSNMSHRDIVFSTINYCLSNGIRDDYLYNDVHVCLDIALTLDMLNASGNVMVCNGFFKKRFLINVYGSMVKEKAFSDSSTFCKYNDSSNSTFYLYRNLEKIQLVNDSLKKIYDGLICQTSGDHYRITGFSSVYDKLNQVDRNSICLEKKNGFFSRR